MSKKIDTPILVPLDLDEFFKCIREIIREEVQVVISDKVTTAAPGCETDGLTYRPLYDMQAVRHLFRDVARSTIYEWIHAGKLIPIKINGRGKVYFLWTDIERLWRERGTHSISPEESGRQAG